MKVEITKKEIEVFEKLLIANRDSVKLQNISGCDYLESINMLNSIRKAFLTASNKING